MLGLGKDKVRARGQLPKVKGDCELPCPWGRGKVKLRKESKETALFMSKGPERRSHQEALPFRWMKVSPSANPQGAQHGWKPRQWSPLSPVGWF